MKSSRLVDRKDYDDVLASVEGLCKDLPVCFLSFPDTVVDAAKHVLLIEGFNDEIPCVYVKSDETA